jgi:cytochrome c oxidase subunit 1
MWGGDLRFTTAMKFAIALVALFTIGGISGVMHASPPPEYNFATIPTVTSRYPLWDRTHPELTRDVPHTREGERAIDVDVGGKHVGHVSHAIGNPPGAAAMPTASSTQRIKSARELGIPMPNPTIKPLFVALFMTLMFASLLLIHKGKTPLAIAGIITFALAMTLMLYSWLLTPLEDEH